MNRKIYHWKLRQSEMQLGERTLIMGIINVTPDSFSDGGRFNDPDRAYARALELEEQGADIIDIGGESTKPGSQRITPDEEWQRLVPVLKRFKGNLRVPISLDTYKSEIAERALQYGVEIFNDPSGLTFDPNLAKVAANGDAGLILNHMRGLPEMWAKLPPMQDVVGTIGRELEAMVNRARHAGVERGRIVIDPGLGFGKRKEQNAEILARLDQLAALDYPILVGPSRKSFLAQATENETLFATAAAVAAAVMNGAHIVRVHDVREMRVAIQVAEEISRAVVVKPEEEEAKSAPRPRLQARPEFEADRPRPTRPPIARPAEVRPVEAPPTAPPPEKREFRPPSRPENREYRPPSRPENREFRPPSRPEKRDFRPAAGKPRFERKFDRKDDRNGPPPRSGPPGPRQDGFKPFDRRGDRKEGRPTAGSRPPKRPFRKRP